MNITKIYFLDEEGNYNGYLFIQKGQMSMQHVNDTKLDKFQRELLRDILMKNGISIG